jgi:hypothetical protein
LGLFAGVGCSAARGIGDSEAGVVGSVEGSFSTGGRVIKSKRNINPMSMEKASRLLIKVYKAFNLHDNEFPLKMAAP